MEYLFFSGPDKTSFAPVENGTAGRDSAVPFHGIVSRGLLNTLIKNDPEGTLWHSYAHRLDTLWEHPELEPGAPPDLMRLLKYAKMNKVLTFSQSALCAQEYVRAYLQPAGESGDMLCELWNIKEGHTSSVWKCSLSRVSTRQLIEEFVLNIARDDAAGAELKATSEKMQGISAQWPDINMAKVLDIQAVTIDYGGSETAIVVTKNDFVANSFEIHVVPAGQSGQEQWLLVERFITCPDNPSRITSVFGRKLTGSEIGSIKDDISSFMSTISSGQEINIRDGDMVWTGKRAVIVAIS